MDNCDPKTFPAGLCIVLPRPGDTTFAEFVAMLFSPLIDSGKVFVGHPARMPGEPGGPDGRGAR
jgi:hypothetical protein